jgi:ribosomal protein L16 Arg81 hydroxylase
VLDVLGLKIAHLYCNLTTKAPTFGEHTDSMDVYFWQCQGSTKWMVNEKIIILNSGDLLFIPKGIKHNVIPLCPRVGISMSYD